jgi:broad specificity phosphatase PhoE/2'-5' RNA ligase
MSYTLVNHSGDIGQFASNAGLTDLRDACDGVPLLRDFFDEGYTDKCGEVALALMKVEGPADVVSTAKGLAEMIKDQEVAAISNGVASDDEDAEAEPTEKVDVQGLPEEVAKSIPDAAGKEIFQRVLAERNGSSEVHAYLKAYHALEAAGYEHDEELKQWVHKDSPTVGDVHVDRPFGAINWAPKKKKRKKKDAGAETDHNADGSDILDDDLDPSKQVDKADVISVDVPLFIRLLEVAREEITEDEPLHVMTERITELLADKKELTMEDYEDIVASIKKRGAEGADGEALGEEDTASGTVQESAVAKRISGNSDISLNQEGRELADKLGERIAARGGLDVLYSSTLPRAVETADAIAEHATPGLKRARTNKLCPWHLGEYEGQMPEDVREDIDRYIEHPEQVPPGKGADGENAESFDAAKSRQLSFLRDVYADSVADPTMKIGLVMHSRGMELLRSWVDAGCPSDFKLDLGDLERPDDPEHTTLLRWHKDEVKAVDVEDDDPLKPGVYLILHGLTDDDTDAGNAEELEKGGPGSGRYPAGSGAKDSHESLLKDHQILFDHPARDWKNTAATPAEDQNYKGMLHDHLAQIEAHGKAFGMPAAAKTHLAQASNYLMTRGNTVSGREGALMSMHNAIRAIGHTVGASAGRELAYKVDAVQKYLPPLEVHRAAKSAYDAGTSVLEITSPLAEHEGLDEQHVRKVAEFWASAEASTATKLTADAWGGKDAAKWAGRVIKKIERDDVQKASNGIMLAFWPDAETQKRIAVAGGELPDDIHVTLAYFGKLDEMPMDRLPAMEKAVEHFADTHSPVQVTLGGVGRFPASPSSDGMDVAYLGVHSDAIQKFRQELVDCVEAMGVEPRKNFGYNPHITLKMVSPHAPHLVPTPEPMEVTFDRVILSIGTARKEYVLAGVVKYSPDQPRDDHGRFGEGSAQAIADQALGKNDRAANVKMREEFNVLLKEQTAIRGDLTKEQDKAVSAYVEGIRQGTALQVYQVVNGSLRGTMELPEDMQPMVETLTDLTHTELPRDITTFRCMEGSRSSSLEVGSVLTDKGFVSSSVGAKQAGNFIPIEKGEGTLVHISAPKGSPALVIPNDYEGEVLFPPGSSFHVTAIHSVESKSDSGKTIRMRVVYANYTAQKAATYAQKAERSSGNLVSRFVWQDGDISVSKVEKRDEFEIYGDIVKVDKAQHLVFGWFSVTEVHGKTIEDTQKDLIKEATIEDSAYEFVLNERKGGAMHEDGKNGEIKVVGQLVESVVFTHEKQEAMLKSLKEQGIDAELNLRAVAWWGGFFIQDPDVWDKITTGHLRAFSIGGKGKRAKIGE